MSPVAISGVDKQGVDINGVQVKQSLIDTSETVNKGVYAATTLSTVDPDLATANIKDAITIFGKLGTLVAGVDVSDADALVADVKDPKTFYSVAAPKKTGTMPTVAITAANDNYLAGYHAGDAGGLDAIDLDLASANIKSGATIFGKAGAATVQDIADADLTVAEAPTGKKFYAVTGGVKTGTGTKTLDPANDTVAAGYYAATTLHAVDADLAVGNIKSGVNIFGFAGTYAPTPTVTEAFWLDDYYLNSEDDWTNFPNAQANIPATAKKIITSAYKSETGYFVRIVYNGVEKASLLASGVGNLRWTGDGIGSAATLVWQHKREEAGVPATAYVRACGGWYVTI